MLLLLLLKGTSEKARKGIQTQGKINSCAAIGFVPFFERVTDNICFKHCNGEPPGPFTLGFPG